MPFDNRYARLPAHFYAQVTPARAPDPQLLAWNEPLAESLGLPQVGQGPEVLAGLFSGNQALPGSEPIALAYAGHQFGNFVPQLGDGRALLLGEWVTPTGERFDLQLKGSGQTPFSRRGDGRSALGPVLREYLVSEAMHRLGVPTTRALAAVRTGETVLRDGREPGGVLTRVAASHLRVGTFEYFAARQDKLALQQLLDYAIARHYPEAAQAERPAVALFAEVVQAQARLVAHWMDVGFIHGVMNTDNTAISGETLDYGPCAFMDEFDYHQVFSSIDHAGRYAYGRQAPIAHWNLARLAEALLMLGDPQSAFEEQLERFPAAFEAQFVGRMARKLGLQAVKEGDDELVTAWMQLLHDRQLDYTLSYRRLAERAEAQDDAAFGAFEQRWRARLQQQALPISAVAAAMNQVNPLYIPRNHQVEKVIVAANAGDMQPFERLYRVLQLPFDEQPGCEAYAQPPQQQERVMQTFCGT